MTAPTLDVHTRDGGTAGTVDLDPAIFDAEIKVGVMHQVVTAQLANARRDTAKVKTRGERRGGGAKPWRQKGTGRARQGSIRAPQWIGGGRVHGPNGQQSHAQRVNKKMKRAALRGALTDRARGDAVRVVADLAFDPPRTKDAVALLAHLDLTEQKVLVVLADRHEGAERSFRNLPGVRVSPVDQLNTYDVLVSDVVVFERDALPLIGTGARASTAAASTDEGTDPTSVETA